MSDSQQPEKKKNWFLRHPVFTVLLVIVVIGIVGMANGDSTPTKVENGNPQQQAKAEEVKESYKVGESIKLGDVILTVNEVQESQGGQYTKPSEGNTWIELNLTVQNTGKNQEYITTLGQMFILDTENNQYQVAVTSKAMENPGSTGLDGALLAGAKKTGWVGFEVPQTATGLKLQYNTSMIGTGSIMVDLGR